MKNEDIIEKYETKLIILNMLISMDDFESVSERVEIKTTARCYEEFIKDLSNETI